MFDFILKDIVCELYLWMIGDVMNLFIVLNCFCDVWIKEIFLDWKLFVLKDWKILLLFLIYFLLSF